MLRLSNGGGVEEVRSALAVGSMLLTKRRMNISGRQRLLYESAFRFWV